MSVTPLAELEWHKSSHSNPDGAACVEIAATPHTVHVRDSKHVPGPHLTFSPTHWAAFLPCTRGDR